MSPAPLTPSRTRLTAIDRMLALIGIAVTGAAILLATDSSGAAQGTQPSAAAAASVGAARPVTPPRTVRAAQPRGETIVHVTPSTPSPAPAAPAQHRAATPRPARPTPYVPTGTGIWIYQWGHSDGGRAGEIVSRSRRVGLSTLFVRTGSSHDGFTGARPLRELLHATRGSDIRVVAWDFPVLRHPAHDARRLAHAARFMAADSSHVAAVAPDIETPAEGTFNAAWRVREYLRVLNRHLPPGVTILTAVPWPSRYRLADYPYAAVAKQSDVLIPMAYWYNNPPALVTQRSIRYLRRFNKPVQPVGQGYDGKLDVPSLHHNHLNREVPAFFRTAHRNGVHAVSIWSWQSAPSATWRALAHAHRMFAPHQ